MTTAVRLTIAETLTAARLAERATLADLDHLNAAGPVTEHPADVTAHANALARTVAEARRLSVTITTLAAVHHAIVADLAPHDLAHALAIPTR